MLLQDIPDVEGDRAFGNQTFSVRHGKKKVRNYNMINLLKRTTKHIDCAWK